VGAEIGMRCSPICTASVSTRRHFQMGPAKKISREFFRTGSVAELFAPSPPDGPPNRARGTKVASRARKG
jgi:hypothetical protein